MKINEFRWTSLAMTMALVISMMVLTSCGDDEPDGEASIVGQWEMTNINVLKTTNYEDIASSFAEVDAVVYEFREDRTMIQYVQKHGKWYIAGKALYTLHPEDTKYGLINFDCYESVGVAISCFNRGSITYEYSLTRKSLSLNAAVSRIDMKFKPTSGVTATEYNQ